MEHTQFSGPQPNRNTVLTCVKLTDKHNRNRNVITDYHQNLTISSLATFPANFVKNQLSSFCVILLTNQLGLTN